MSTDRYGLTNPAFLDPEQHRVIGRVILASVRSKLELPYWLLALLVSGWIAWRGYVHNTSPDPVCDDGHCPDPGTKEYLAGIQYFHDHAYEWAVRSFCVCIAIAIILRVAALIWGSLLVAFYGDINAAPAD